MATALARGLSTILNRQAFGLCNELQQWRGIRVQVRYGNLEQALALLQRKMQSSGIERMIKREQTHHIKNSEKRVLARKALERRIRSQDFARKLKSVLLKKVRWRDFLFFLSFFQIKMKLSRFISIFMVLAYYAITGQNGTHINLIKLVTIAYQLIEMKCGLSTIATYKGMFWRMFWRYIEN